ncbi:TetR family transcriptional regulator [Amycolatopsis sp. NBRC 101858]|uniref:TetR/AcrR family transcriptional regulator n=1 Tax=Amycolatopsis sp. NBRC 101858 TaxID=3032200 RepID=UPI0024A49F0F|nr:TetR/AcrR family transcriptional regulator [Amycolatopsis sp. NBRC 101858]GLY42886.1 TetR family transcriptional regulator [Amycolatopsis sp. NBRC 101858]
MTEQDLTRRDRHRLRTIAEIKETALTQVRTGGPEAVSLAAVARSMAMSPPALYRYFASRNELLAELTVDIHLALADTLEAAASGCTSPVSRLRAVAGAYRNWALTQPHAYRLTCESPHESGHDHSGDRIVSAAQRSMDVLLDAVTEAGDPPHAAIPAQLHAQLYCRAGNSGHRSRSAGELHFGLVWWSRLHGLISLELGRHTAATGVDPALLYRSEVEAMISSLCSRHDVTT